VIRSGRLKLKTTLSAEAWDWTLSQTNSFQFTPSHPMSLRSMLMFFLPSVSYKRYLPLRSSNWNVLCISNFTHACPYATHLMLHNLVGIRVLYQECYVLFFSYILAKFLSSPVFPVLGWVGLVVLLQVLHVCEAKSTRVAILFSYFDLLPPELLPWVCSCAQLYEVCC
jgi:hypothetical protein